MGGEAATSDAGTMAAPQQASRLQIPGSDIENYVHQLINPATRENALLELSKKRENFPELAPYLWYSFGTMAALLQEIISAYPLLSPPGLLTAHASNRVCNALALLQCVASHQDTRSMFLQGESHTPHAVVHAGYTPRSCACGHTAALWHRCAHACTCASTSLRTHSGARAGAMPHISPSSHARHTGGAA